MALSAGHLHPGSEHEAREAPLSQVSRSGSRFPVPQSDEWPFLPVPRTSPSRPSHTSDVTKTMTTDCGLRCSAPSQAPLPTGDRGAVWLSPAWPFAPGAIFS